MKINQIIINETTTAGAVATVAKPMGETQKRPEVKGLHPAGSKMKKKGPYANSLNESKMKELSMDLSAGKDGLNDADFKKKYGKSKEEMRKSLKQKPEPVKEEKLEEDDLILIPGQGRIRKTGFIKHDPDKAEHEGQTLKNSLHTIIRVATHLNKELSVRDNFPEWVSEKIGAVKSNMVTVMDYLISAKEMGHDFNEMTGGVIAGGGVGEGKKIPASNKPVDPRDLVVPLSSVPVKKPRGHTQYDPANEFPGVKSFKKEGMKEGKFVKGPGGVPSDRYGNPIEPKPPKGVGAVTLRQLEKNRRENPGQSPFKTQDEKVKKYLGSGEQGVEEGAKVDRMVKHITQSEKKLGHSKKEAENIAWATANKRGMLDNKNEKGK